MSRFAALLNRVTGMGLLSRMAERVTFVLIQVLLVAMIIAFPGLVSSGLSNEPTIDADKVFQQMQTDKAAVAAPEAAASGGAASTEPAAASDDKEDPMKGLMDAIKEDQAKKKP